MIHVNPLSTPPILRVDRNQTFWRLTVPLAVLQACAGNMLLLATWVTTAALLAQDAALRGTPRPMDELCAAIADQLGLSDYPPAVITCLLAELERLGLLVRSGSELFVPVLTLAEASLREAQQLQDEAEVVIHRQASPHRQDALPGLVD